MKGRSAAPSTSHPPPSFHPPPSSPLSLLLCLLPFLTLKPSSSASKGAECGGPCSPRGRLNLGVPVPQQTSRGSPIAQEVPDHSWADSEAEAGGGGGGSGCEVLTVPWATQTHPVAFTHTITHTVRVTHTAAHPVMHSSTLVYLPISFSFSSGNSPQTTTTPACPFLVQLPGAPTAGRRTTFGPSPVAPSNIPGHPPWLVYRLRSIDPLWLPAVPPPGAPS